MRYRLESLDSAAPPAGTVTCLDANPASIGPNRVPVARYTGPLIYTEGARDPYYPACGRGDGRATWEDLLAVADVRVATGDPAVRC